MALIEIDGLPFLISRDGSSPSRGAAETAEP